MLNFDPEPVGTGDFADITVDDASGTANGAAVLATTDNTMVIQFDRELDAPESITIGAANATTFAGGATLAKPDTQDVVGFQADAAVKTDANHVRLTFLAQDGITPIVITAIPDETHWEVSAVPASAVAIGPGGAYVEITFPGPVGTHGSATCDDGASVSNGPLNWLPVWEGVF